MDDTLFTFIVDFCRPASMVNLLGSWDNFQRSYPLKKEKRGGRETWRRYSDFKAIVCDGDRLRSPDEGRDGSLKMGGTYWYYYQIDNDGEFCDPSMPTTRTCPFLPGQEVNILEVPSKPAAPRFSGESTVSLTQYTLDPDEKYRTRPGKEPTVPSARQNSPVLPSAEVHEEKNSTISTGAEVDRDITHATPATSSVNSRSKLSMNRPFGTRNQSGDYDVLLPEKVCSLDRPCTMPTMITTPAYGDSGAKERPIYTSSGVSIRQARPNSPWQKLQTRFSNMSRRSSSKVPPTMRFSLSEASRSPGIKAAEILQSPVQLVKPPAGHLPNSRPETRPESFSEFDLESLDGNDFERTLYETGLVSKSSSKRTGHGASPVRGSQRAFKLVHSNTTSTRSSAFYSGFDLTRDQTVATQSPPITPESSNGGFSFRIEEEEEEEEGEDDTRGRWCCSRGDDASVLTLQNVNKLPDSISTPNKPSRQGRDPASKRVKEWTATIETSKTEVDDIANDLSYLCSIIS